MQNLSGAWRLTVINHVLGSMSQHTIRFWRYILYKVTMVISKGQVLYRWSTSFVS